MKKQVLKNQYETTPSGQLVIVLSNTKYNYEHFTEFHQTVLDILGSNDLSKQGKLQLKNTVFFINMVLGLLDSPERAAIEPYFDEDHLTDRKQGKPKKKNVIATANSHEGHNNSQADLEKLLNWINQIVTLKRITLEKLLDEFYNLGIIELKK